MKRCILVSVRPQKDKETNDDLLFLTLYRLPNKMKNGGLWHPKKDEQVINACINAKHRPEEYKQWSSMPNQKSESVLRCLNRLEYRFGKNFKKVFKSITVDNGSEFSDYMGLQRSIYNGQRTTVYYCHPYCSSERGTNERINREIRRLIPKGSDLSKYSVDDIQRVEDWVNNYPRQVLDFATSKELFEEQLSAVV